MADGAGCKPDFVPPKEDSVIYLCNQPGTASAETEMKRAASSSLFDLAPDGVCPAPFVASGAVVSYTTFSPLSQHPSNDAVGTVCFLWHFPSAWIWPSVLPLLAEASCPVESGLSSPRQGAQRPNTGYTCRRHYTRHGSKYNNRPQYMQVVISSSRRASCVAWGGSFM